MDANFFEKFEAVWKAYVEWILKVLKYWFPEEFEDEATTEAE